MPHFHERSCWTTWHAPWHLQTHTHTHTHRRRTERSANMLTLQSRTLRLSDDVPSECCCSKILNPSLLVKTSKSKEKRGRGKSRYFRVKQKRSSIFHGDHPIVLKSCLSWAHPLFFCWVFFFSFFLPSVDGERWPFPSLQSISLLLLLLSAPPAAASEPLRPITAEFRSLSSNWSSEWERGEREGTQEGVCGGCYIWKVIKHRQKKPHVQESCWWTDELCVREEDVKGWFGLYFIQK